MKLFIKYLSVGDQDGGSKMKGKEPLIIHALEK